MFFLNNSDITIGLFFILGFAMFAMCVLSYVFSSLAFYRFMKERNLKKAFRAWIPFAFYYTVGRVYDDINEKHGKTTNFATIMDVLAGCIFLVIFIPITPIISKLIIILILVSPLMSMEFNCYKLIFKEYAPNNSKYVVLTKMFMIMPIAPFVPGLCLLKASKNQPISAITY